MRLNPSPIHQSMLRILGIGLLVPAHFVIGKSLFIVPPNANWDCTPQGKHWHCTTTQTGATLYQNQATASQTKQSALSKALGWVPDNGNDPSNCSSCGGHYAEPALPYKGKLQSLQDANIKASFKKARYKLNGNLILEGPIVITQPSRWLYADSAVITPNAKTKHLERIQARGNLQLRQPGQLILGKEGEADLIHHRAYIKDVHYLIRVRPNLTKGPDKKHYRNFTGYAHGKATVVKQLNQNNYTLKQATYTTCPPGRHTWTLAASQINLDRQSGRGTADNTVLKIHGIPIFYSPYFNFPIDHRRKTGFLYGSLGNSGNSGAYVNIPYYFNLAPNFDDTLTPTIYSRRGVLFSNDFRYLTPWTRGNAIIRYIPVDIMRNHSSRGSIHLGNLFQFSSNWTGNLDYNRVSDQRFLKDFDENSNAIVANTVLLNQSASVQYNNLHWQVTGALQSYQIVNPELDLVNRPYRRLPEIDIKALYPNLFSPFDLHLSAQFVNFQKDSYQNVTPVQGQRYHINPSISIPARWAFGYFTPKAQFDSTTYTLQDTSDQGYPRHHIQRSIPIISANSGLYFDRNFLWNHQSYTQTVEPHLFYLYVPYRNQNDIPIFDTSIQNFDYNTLFSTNRFSGIDRIGDTNQLTYALSTYVRDSQGKTLFNAAIGQIHYFHDRRVTLCSNNANNTNCIRNEDPNYNDSTSDIAGKATLSLGDNWYANTNLTYNPHYNQLDLQSYQLQYKPDPHHIFNIGYQNNQRDFSLLSTEQLQAGEAPPNLSQLTTSTIWQLSTKWSVLGQWNYAFNASRTIDIFGGVEYSSCCWAVRFVLRRYISNENPNNPAALTGPLQSATFLQFELKGLGSTSESQIESLEEQIPGYDPNESGSDA